MKIRRLSLGVMVLLVSTTGLTFFVKKVDFSRLWVELTAEQAAKDRINIPSLAPLVERTSKAVILINTEVKQAANQMQMEGIPPELYRYFGQQPQIQPERKAQGQGSGFLIHPSGLALTNFHVIEGATSIKVRVGEELQDYEAEVVGSDAATDVALLRIKSKKANWPFIPLGKSHDLRVGDFVVATGAPQGLQGSYSFGIVSALGRRDVAPSGRQGLYDFIQTDAAINFGNSGGPLINLTGEAVGINTAISAQGQNIGFAIPIDQVKQMLPALEGKGKVSRSWLGVRIQDIAPEVAKELGLTTANGALVREVIPGGPADKAGIKAGDVIVEFDNISIKTSSSLQSLAGLAGVDKIISLKVMREGKPKALSMKLEKMQEENQSADEKPSSTDSMWNELGMQVTEVDPKVGIKGAYVSKVGVDSFAQRIGIEVKDIIVKVNGKEIDSAKTLTNVIKNTKSGGVIRLHLRRGNATIFVIFPKP